MIRIDGLVTEFDDGAVRAVDELDLEVRPGSLVTLLGPSGCGKTTTLRAVAGLSQPDGGRIHIGDELVFDAARGIHVPPNRRRIGMVFQSYAIWPHLTVFENVAYPLKGRGSPPKSEVRRRVLEALGLVGLAELADRPSPNLSGGQQQRVALARALVSEPEVLLLDEPLSNLDAQLRGEMRREIRVIQQRLGITTLYVTHDQSEALAISDEVVVMRAGRIDDRGTPEELYERPGTRFSASFLGVPNLIGVAAERWTDATGGLARIEGSSGLGPISYRAPVGDGVRSGRTDTLAVRPQDVRLSADPPTAAANVWRGRLQSSVFLGERYEVVVDVGGERLTAHVERGGPTAMGDEVYVHIPPDLVALPEPSAIGRRA